MRRFDIRMAQNSPVLILAGELAQWMTLTSCKSAALSKFALNRISLRLAVEVDTLGC
jgi:hypothetical protein